MIDSWALHWSRQLSSVSPCEPLSLICPEAVELWLIYLKALKLPAVTHLQLKCLCSSHFITGGTQSWLLKHQQTPLLVLFFRVCHSIGFKVWVNAVELTLQRCSFKLMHHGSKQLNQSAAKVFFLLRHHTEFMQRKAVVPSFSGTKCHFSVHISSLQSGNMVSQHHNYLASVSTSEVMMMHQTDVSAVQDCIFTFRSCLTLLGFLETSISVRNKK